MSPVEVRLNFRPQHAKLLVPAAGVLAGYLGAFAAAKLVFIALESPWTTAPLIWLGFCLAGVLAMIPVDKALGNNAAHVDLLRIPVYWTVAALSLLLLHWLAAAAFSLRVPSFVDNLALWGAGVLAVWLDEPGADGLNWLRRLAARKGRPPS